MLTTTLLAIAAAQDLGLQVDGDPLPGEAIAITIDGLLPGEPAYLGTSPELGTTCPASTSPVCSDLAHPRLLARGTPAGSTVTVEVTLPAEETVHHLQAITAYGVSQVVDIEVLAIDPLASDASTPPVVVGVAILCDVDTVDLIAQYMGEADRLRADAYRDGALVASHPLTPEPAAPGTLFFDATASGEEAPSCADLTWVIEASSATTTTCVVRGDEADLLRDDGEIDPDCADI